MKIALASDFRDYYDHRFELPHRPHDYLFERYAKGGMSKREQFALLDSILALTPMHGLVRDVAERGRGKVLEVVVYLDEYAHAGEGKVRMATIRALREYPDHYCCAFIPTGFQRAVSIRHLQIGNRGWRLQYEVKGDEWRSNCGAVEIKLLSEWGAWERGRDMLAKYPLFAIDFVGLMSRDWRDLRAIDFNTAPGLKGTGIEAVLSPQEVCDLISEHIESRVVEGER